MQSVLVSLLLIYWQKCGKICNPVQRGEKKENKGSLVAGVGGGRGEGRWVSPMPEIETYFHPRCIHQSM